MAKRTVPILFLIHFVFSAGIEVKRFHIPPEISCPYNAACLLDLECSGNCDTELKCLQINAIGERRCLTNDNEFRAACISCDITPLPGKSMASGRNRNGKKFGNAKNF